MKKGKQMKRVLRVNIKLDPTTGDKFLFINKKKYWIKEGTTKAKIASFVKKKVKSIGIDSFERRNIPIEINQQQPLRLEHELETIQQRRAEPKEYELYQLSKDALISLAQQKGIPNSNRMTKSQLISILGNIPMEEKPPKIKEPKGHAEQEKAPLEQKISPPTIPLSKQELKDLLKVRNIKFRSNASLETLYSLYNSLKEQQQQLADETVSPSDREELQPILPRRRRAPPRQRRSAPPAAPPSAPAPTSASDLDFETPEVKMDETTRPPLVPRMERGAPAEQNIVETKQNDPLKLGSDKIGTAPEKALIEAGDVLEGKGKSDTVDERGLSNDEIDEIMKPLGDFYLGTIAHDQIHSIILPKIKPRSNGAFIINTDPASKGGCHWQAIAFFASPNSTHEINFFDSFGDPIDNKLRKDLKDIANKLDAKTFLKLKENSVQLQNDRTSTCGFHCIRFILDRHRGKTFSQATGYDDKVKDDSIRGEGEINRFKKQIGFGFIPSFLQRPNSMMQQIKDKIKEKIFFPSREFSNAFKSIMSKYGNLKIMSAKIRRAPIGTAINSLLNILSFGKFEQYRKEKNFDKYFHLGIVLELQGGKKLLLEKNAKPEFSENFKDTSDTVYMGPVTISGQPTLNEFIQKTVDKVGKYTFSNYDPFKNNCQAFILMLLEANNSLTPSLKNFIYQDVQTLLERIPSFTDKIARFATDTAARVQELTGNGTKPKRLKHAKFLKLMEKFKK
jgi:hypothetical protein